MSEIVYCKDCSYAEPNNLDAYNAVKSGVFCARYRQNTAGIHGCDNGKPKAKTNADRFRAKSDEELAEWISNQGIDCAYCRIESLCYEECKCDDCKKAWLKWLKQEADT